MPNTARPDLPWDGGCRCGALRFRVSLPPLFTAACHCTGCQRMTSSAFSLSIAVPEGGFAVTQGTPVSGGVDPTYGHSFCESCKTWIFTKSERMQGFTNVRATLLDDSRWYQPFVETYTSEKLAWVTTPARYSYEAFPSMEDLPRLLADFAAHG